jgi:hypothetical protein
MGDPTASPQDLATPRRGHETPFGVTRSALALAAHRRLGLPHPSSERAAAGDVSGARDLLWLIPMQGVDGV